jgi:SAM-dependent methyltransferase
MYVLGRSLQLVRNAIAAYGPPAMKKVLWDREYSAGQWNFNDDTSDDCLYPHLVRHANHGSILDLGCGSGNTANELAGDAYQSYLGVDISEAALDKARRRTEQTGRAHKNMFLMADFMRYEPPKQFDLILLRHSLYMVPLNKVKATLDRYARYLKDGGVFVVSIHTTQKGKTKHRPMTMVHTIEAAFHIVEKGEYGQLEPTVIVFRPKLPPGRRLRH